MSGGAGVDQIEVASYGGTVNVDGGADDDYIYVSVEQEWIETYNPVTETWDTTFIGGLSTVSGGEGNDTIQLYNYGGSATVSGGDGDDFLSLRGTSPSK